MVQCNFGVKNLVREQVIGDELLFIERQVSLHDVKEVSIQKYKFIFKADFPLIF